MKQRPDDKRYREAMAEITSVLRRHDMAGAITLVSKERAMFKYIFPTWSCIRIEGDNLRFRSKLSDYPSREAQHEAAELSTHIVLQMRDIAAQTFGITQQIYEQLKDAGFEIEHESYADFDPEREH